MSFILVGRGKKKVCVKFIAAFRKSHLFANITEKGLVKEYYINFSDLNKSVQIAFPRHCDYGNHYSAYVLIHYTSTTTELILLAAGEFIVMCKWTKINVS